MQLRLAPALALVATLSLTACSGDRPTSPDPDAGGPSPAGPHADGRLTITDDAVEGPPRQVADALGADGPLKVGGALFVDAEGAILLCSAIAESFPPQCGGDRLEVVGLDPEALDLEEAGGVRWAEGVELTGIVD